MENTNNQTAKPSAKKMATNKTFELHEDDIFHLKNGSAIMNHLANEPSGRHINGYQVDNIVNKGWYLFEGEYGKMEPTKKLSELEVRKMLREDKYEKKEN